MKFESNIVYMGSLSLQFVARSVTDAQRTHVQNLYISKTHSIWHARELRQIFYAIYIRFEK